MLAFEAELAHLPRSLIAALWEAIDPLNHSGEGATQGLASRTSTTV
jgi:hypothetical protein